MATNIHITLCEGKCFLELLAYYNEAHTSSSSVNLLIYLLRKMCQLEQFQATFAEIPGVLETGTIRKIDRRYPFNDACQVN